MKPPIMLKLGGSFINYNNEKALHKIGNIIHQFSAEYPFLIVPGGGPFADTVRWHGKQLNLSEETCHFMALLAMDQYAFLLKEFIPESVLTYLSPKSISQPSNTVKPQILLSSHFLGQLSSLALPRSWKVTSDSIAAYLASQFNISLLIIVKSIDLDTSLTEPGVDYFFHNFLPLKNPVWFINGLYPERLSQLLQSGSTTGINIPANSLSANSLNTSP